MPYRKNDYSFVIDSSFQPFSMQEMLVPFTMYKDAYEKSEAAYDELSQKAGDFEYLASTLPEGSRARDIYEGYANDLKAQAADLSHNGLSMNNRRALASLKQRYEGEIGRLKKIDAIRKAQIEEQKKLALQDPTRLFSREAAMTPFDDYLDNPDLSYNSYSGALLAQQVGQAASAIAKSLTNYSNGQPIDKYTKTWLEQHGFTPAQVAQAIQNPDSPGADAVLKTLVQNTIDNSGIAGWADPATLNQAYAYARQGLWNAVGQTQVHSYEDYAAKAALTHYYHELEADNAATRAAEQARQQQAQALAGSLAINPLNIYSAKEQDRIAKNMRDYAEYFTTDSNGRTVLSQKGLEEYNRNAAPKVSTSASGGGTARLMNAETQLQSDKGYQPTEFKKFVDNELNGASFIKKKQYGNLGNRWNQYNKDNSSSKYDATRSTEFDYTITDAQQKDYKSAIQTAARGTELQEVDFDPKTNTFKPSGDKLSMSDLNSDKYTVVSTRFSPYGSTVMIKDKNGEVHRYKMPDGINTTNEANRDLAMQYAQRIQNAFSEYSQKGYYTDTKGNKVTPTQEEMAKLAQDYKKYVQMAYLYHSQLGVQNKTKEQEFNPYGF